MNVEMIPVGKLVTSKQNVRLTTGDTKELVASVKAVGVLEPLIVVAEKARGTKYEIVCGGRRYEAAREVKLLELPCIVRTMSEQEQLEASLTENLQRENLSPLDEAHGYEQLVKLGLTQRQIATQVGVSQSQVSKRLALLTLPVPVQEEVDSGGITLEEAASVAKLVELGVDADDVTDVVAQGKKWSQVGLQADRLAHDVAAQQKVAEVIGLLKKRPGARVHDEPVNVYQPPAGMRVVSQKEIGAIPMTKEAHEKLPCHVLGVDRLGAEVVLCDDPDTHAAIDPAAGKQEAAKKGRAKRKAHEKALAEAAGERKLQYGLLLSNGGFARSTEGTTLLAQRAVLSAAVEVRKGACTLLGLEPVADPKGYMQPDTETPLIEYGAKGASQARQVQLAIALAGGEFELVRSYVGWGDEEKAFIDSLVAAGYVLSKAEQAEYDGKAPPR